MAFLMLHCYVRRDMDQCSERLGDLFWRVSSRHCASASHRQPHPPSTSFRGKSRLRLKTLDEKSQI
jgi:hypothetical protein